MSRLLSFVALFLAASLAAGNPFQPAFRLDSSRLPPASEVCAATTPISSEPAVTLAQAPVDPDRSPALQEVATQELAGQETELKQSLRRGATVTTCHIQRQSDRFAITKPPGRVAASRQGKPEFSSALAAARSGFLSAPSTAPPSLS